MNLDAYDWTGTYRTKTSVKTCEAVCKIQTCEYASVSHATITITFHRYTDSGTHKDKNIAVFDMEK